MNTLFEPWFRPHLDAIVRQVSPPVAPFRYGTDIACTDDIPADFREVSADDHQGIAESLVRRLLTPRGGLIDDPTYGDGLMSLIHHGITVQELAGIQQRIEQECRKDDRIDRCVVQVSPVPEPLSTGHMIVTLKVSAQDPSQSFTLVLGVDGSGLIIDLMVRRELT